MRQGGVGTDIENGKGIFAVVETAIGKNHADEVDASII